MTYVWGSKIWLVGPPGAGKSTLGRELGSRLARPHIELDRLYWRPEWQQASEEEFLTAVTEVASTESWIIDGQYDMAHGILRNRADMAIWLDLKFAVAFGRLVRRTIRRLSSQEILWNGNRERMFNALHLLSWSIGQYSKVRKTNKEIAAFLHGRQVPCLRIRSSAELARVLSSLEVIG